MRRRVSRPAGAHVDESPALGALDAIASKDAPQTWGDASAESVDRLLRDVPPHYGKTH